eukprot:GHVU01077931.1.p1 GENE.GHVU01077931.1~~GHVU01077931.1.p1  ORF type:complete len:198 (+),score=18.80 GHVU01077931.1:87-680(+)
MSQFRDTFSKDQKKDNLLDYDDSAWLFFAGTVLLCVLLPWTYYFVVRVVLSSLGGKKGYPVKTNAGSAIQYCKCSLCKKFEHEQASKKFKNLFSVSYIVQAVVILLGWLLLLRLAWGLAEVKQIQAFDPFEILGIAAGTSESAIKKAYRMMSLKYHPDKNPNDATAAAKFVLISKAYQSLTDPVRRRTCSICWDSQL